MLNLSKFNHMELIIQKKKTNRKAIVSLKQFRQLTIGTRNNIFKLSSLIFHYLDINIL